MSKILVATDFSPSARDAVRVGVRLATSAGRESELVIAHIWRVPTIAFASEPYEPDALWIQQAEDAARNDLEVARREAEELGARQPIALMEEGVPWSRITELLEGDPEFELAVLGTRGRTGIARFVLGSVAETVVRHAPCSVLVVRGDTASKPFTDVLCPVDFSETSRVAARRAAELVRPGGGGLTLLHAIETPVAISGETFPRDFLRDIDRRSARSLTELAAELRTRTDVPVITRTRVGYPGAQILSLLDDEPSFDLVVMGSHGRTGIRRVLLGSVAEKVVRHARCPVLVARDRAAS